MQKTPSHVAAACLDMILGADQRAKLKKLKVPTAVLHGKHDALFALDEAQAMAKQIPDAELVVFEQSGHAPHLEETDAFNAALGKLLAR
jgi:pimeloyl-ACP methyl ester carboxylesterase